MFHTAMELAGNDLINGDLQGSKSLSQCSCLLTAFIRELPLSPNIVQVERVCVGLIRVGLRMSDKDDVPAALKCCDEIFFIELAVGFRDDAEHQ